MPVLFVPSSLLKVTSYFSTVAALGMMPLLFVQHVDEPPSHHDLILPSGCLRHDASLDLPHGSPPHRGSKPGQTSRKILISLNVDRLIFLCSFDVIFQKIDLSSISFGQNPSAF